MAERSPDPVALDDKSLERDENTSTQSTSLSEKEHVQPLDPNVEHGIPIIDTTQDADEKVPHETTIDHDENIVDWDGLDDPQKAMNWTDRKKWSNVAIISSVTFLTPLASSMVAPAIPLIMDEFHSTNTLPSLALSSPSIFWATHWVLLFLAPCSEVWGRLPVYHICNFMFVCWTIGCALSPGIASLLVFRLLAGIAGSCPLTIGGGSIADLIAQEKRGGAMALFALGPLLGPVIGPVAGGYLGQGAGWRWVFWLITIAGGVALTCSVTFMRETFEPVLLEQKAKRLRKETGNPNLRSRLDPGIPTRDFFIRALIRPTKMLIFSPIVLSLSIYMAVIYGYLYLLFTTLTLVFERTYHFSQGTVGLAFLGIGIGSLFGLVIFGILSDKMMKSMSAKNNGEMKPEFRLPPLIPGSLVIPIGLL